MKAGRVSFKKAGVFALLLAGQAKAGVQYLGIGTVPGEATDSSGLIGALEDGTPHNRMGGFGSSIDYTGIGNSFVLVPDRGPADGQTSYLDRMYFADIAVSDGQVTVNLKQTVLLRSPSGENFTGSAAAISTSDPSDSLRFDPEGVRVSKSGDIFISDEYGPSLIQFSPDGNYVRAFNVPAALKVDVPSANPADELPPRNLKGRVPNRGMEGLALSVDGTKLYGIMQSALIQDSVDEEGKRLGTNVRIVEFDVNSGEPLRQFLYVMEHKKNGLSEILAVGDGQFLVIERDGKPGAEAAYKRIYKVDLAAASDISAFATLPAFDVPDGVSVVKKELLIDFLEPATGVPRAKVAEKIEGLAFGPDLEDGRKLLLVSSDNDFVATEPSYFYAFAVSGF